MGLFQLSGSPAGTVDTTRSTGLGTNLQQPVMQQLQNTLGGNYLFGGAGFNQAQQAAANSIMPQVQSAFGSAGRSGSGLAQSEMTRQLSDSFAGLYNNERNRQLQAASLAPSVDGTQTLSEPYFENDLATALGLLGGASSLFGGDGILSGAGGALGSIGDALGLTGDGGLLSGLFGGGSAAAGALGPLGNAGINSAIGDSTGAALDAASFTPGAGSSGASSPSIPGLDSIAGGLGAGAIGGLSSLGNAGISSALGNQVGAALDLAAFTPGAGTAGATGTGLGSFAGAAIPLAGLAAMGGLIASGKAKINASKEAKEASIRSLHDQIGTTGGTVNLPGAGTHTLLPFPRDGGGWIETANGGQVQVQNDGTWIYISPEQRAERAGITQAAEEQAALVGPVLQNKGLYVGSRIGSDGGR